MRLNGGIAKHKIVKHNKGNQNKKQNIIGHDSVIHGNIAIQAYSL